MKLPITIAIIDLLVVTILIARGWKSGSCSSPRSVPLFAVSRAD